MTIEQIRSYLGQTEEQFNSAISALKEKEPQIISGGYAFETYFDGKIVLNINSLRSHLVEDSFITTGVIVALNFGIKKVQIYYTSDIKDAIFYYRTTETSNFPLSWEIIEESRMFAESSMLANVRNLAVPTIVGSGTGISFSNVHKIPTVANTSKVESKLLSSTGEVPSSNDNGDANKPISEIADRLKFIGDEVQKRAGLLDVANHENNTQIHTSQAEKDTINTHMSDTVKHVTQANKDTWNGKATIKGLESGSVKEDYTVDFNTIKTNWASISRNNPNRPPTNEYGILSVYGDGFAAIQTFMNITGADLVYKRSLVAGNWQPWQLISAPKMFATGYIDEVRFNGTTEVIKSVFFDDGFTRDVRFYKMSASDYVFCFDNRGSGYQILSIAGGKIKPFLYGTRNSQSLFYALTYQSFANPPLYDNGATLTFNQVTITIKL